MEQKKEDCLVSCVDAGLGYENRAIIEHLDFSVHRGEYICVVGENGSGAVHRKVPHNIFPLDR